MGFEEHMMPLLRLIEEGFNAGDLDALGTFVSEEVVDHAPVPWEPAAGGVGFDAMRKRIAVMRAMFPDARMEVDDVLYEGDRVAWRWTMTGTHTGEALGVPPTGEPLLVHGISLATVRRGKIVEHWVYSDAGGTSLPGYRPD